MSCGCHQCLAVCVALFLATTMLLPPAACVIQKPGFLLVSVGKDAVFRWNTTNAIDVAELGLKNPSGNFFITRFIYTDSIGRVAIDNTLFKGRVSFVGDLTAGHAWFKLRNVSVNDTNIYDARIREVRQSSQWFFMKLQVSVTPQFTTVPPSSKTITEGDDLSIQCSAKGTPAPQVKWLLNGNILSQGQGNVTLNIVNIPRSQSGIYECHASNNPNEEPATTTTHVTVYYKPRISQGCSSNSISSWKGNTIMLKCVVSSTFPSPHFTWYKPNGDVIPCNQCSKTVSSQVTVQTGQNSGDYGLYRCIATNVVGSDQHFINVTEFSIQPESSPELIHLKVHIHQTSVTLAWSKPEGNTGKITHYTIYKKVFGADVSWSKVVEVNTTSYTVEDLDPGRYYSFLVTASNQYGESLKDDSKAKTVVIPESSTAIIFEPTKRDKECKAYSKVNTTAVVVLSAFLAVSLLVIILLVLYIWRIKRRIKLNKRKRENLTYKDAVEFDKITSSTTTLQPPAASQQDVEYESVEISATKHAGKEPSHYQELDPSTRNEIRGNPDNKQTSQVPCHYQELNTIQNDSAKTTYEPLRFK